MPTIVCHQCGREFDAPSYRAKFCADCNKIRVAARRKASRTETRSGWGIGNGLTVADSLRKAFPPSDETIMTAKVKPRGVSDRRWRMELARRSNKERYALAPDAASVQGSGGRETYPVFGRN